MGVQGGSTREHEGTGGSSPAGAASGSGFCAPLAMSTIGRIGLIGKSERTVRTRPWLVSGPLKPER
jgi:hypothetical protein